MKQLAILPTISTLCIIISAILLAGGWRYIKKGDVERHKKFMLGAAGFALLFFLIYLTRTLFIGNTAFGGPEHLKIYYTIFLVFHIILATFGAVFGIMQIRSGLKNRLKQHKKVGPLASTVWLFTALTGVAVYIFLYVLYPGGETTSLLKAIFNF